MSGRAEFDSLMGDCMSTTRKKVMSAAIAGGVAILVLSLANMTCDLMIAHGETSVWVHLLRGGLSSTGVGIGVMLYYVLQGADL